MSKDGLVEEDTKTAHYLHQHEDEEYQNDDTEDENDPYLQMIQFESIRNPDKLEEAISVQWHESMSQPLLLSTLLQPDDLAPLFAGAQWAGTRVWHAAIASIHYITKHAPLSKSSRLLELGCGLGVPGMILHQLYGCHVCLTDQESILSQLERNLQHNFPTSCTTIRAQPLSWSKQDVSDLLKQEDYDVVLNCDCVYEPLYGDSWKLLVECMDELLRRNPRTLMLTSVERRTADGVDKFIKKLRESPHVSNVDLVWSDADYRIEIYSARGVQ